MKTTVVGGYPKILEDQLLRKTLWEIDREGGKANGKLEEAVQKVTRSAIREQEEAGLDIVSDGAIRWEDEITASLRGMEGMEFTGLIRYFDTNVLYRQPVVTRPVKLKIPALAADYSFAVKNAKRPVKAIMTGPFTIAKASRDEYYQNGEKFVLAFAEALRGEREALERAGAKKIQINEPFLLSAPEEFELFRKGFRTLAEGARAELELFFSFGDFSKVFPKIMDVCVWRVGFDLGTARNPERILKDKVWKGRKLLAGVIDARNTRLETKEELHGRLKAALACVASQDLEVAPSANLEFLPLDRCRAKLKNLVKLTRDFKEVV
ncbi:MAG: hypothetical protein HYY14_03485 [Candidatus Omnitrophica bacterium]|nr:hypothetical protein [Candidatus Omnitrophota bacterium]